MPYSITIITRVFGTRNFGLTPNRATFFIFIFFYMSKYDWSKERIEKAIKLSDSYSETLRKLGIPTSGRNSDTLKSKIKQYDLDVSHFTFRSHYKAEDDNDKYIPAKVYLVKGSTISSNRLKTKLIKEGIKENKCENPNCPCKSGYWLDNLLVCQLHHIDGDNTNNELSNLQMLCPNCHSQTDNFCGSANTSKKNYCIDCGKEITREAMRCPKCSNAAHRKVENRPSKEDLLDDFRQLNSFSSIARKYKVTDNTIKKWFKSYNLPTLSSKVKNFLKNQQPIKNNNNK